MKHKPLKIKKLNKTKKTILKLLQNNTFPKKIKTLQKIQRKNYQNDYQFTKTKKTKINKSNTLYYLNPFLNRNELIYINEKLNKSQKFSKNFKHPTILPKKNIIIHLVIHNAHKKIAHTNKNITLNKLKNQY